jgi:protein-L-isoaspartate(D-aspartate) O-methyltransferase
MSSPATQSDMAIARKAMIDSQLRTSGINEPYVLKRMNAVPRENYVPKASASLAYIDRAVPLGKGQFLSSPLVHGKMLAEAAPQADDSVLVVENGNGYLAELIRPLAASVDSRDAAEAAQGKGRKSYTLIIIDGAIEHLPAGLAKQLAQGGRIVTGLVLRDVTRLAMGRQVAGNIALQPLAEIGIPVLADFAKAKEWSFS